MLPAAMKRTIACLLFVEVVAAAQSAPRRLRSLKGHQNFVTALAFGKAGKLLASASTDGTVRLWDPVAEKLVRTIALPEGDLATGLCVTPDGARVIASVDASVIAWSADKGDEAWRRGVGGAVRAIALSGDGSLVAVAAGDVRILGGESGEETQKLAAADVTALALSADGATLATAGAGGVKLWDRATGKARKTLSEGLGAASLAFSADGRRLAAAGDDSQVHVYDVEVGAEIWAKPELASGTTVAIDGKLVIAGFGLKRLAAWGLEKGDDKWWVQDRGAEIHIFAVAPGVKRIATGGPDGVVVLWGP